MPTKIHREAFIILFADIAGFSALKEPIQHKAFFEHVLPLIGRALYEGDEKPEKANTWGDGLFAYFRSHTDALHRALALRDAFRAANWRDKGLPQLEIRIALHAGEAFIGRNPITGNNDIIGTEVNRAARLEPVVKPNHVYTTKKFMEVCCNDPQVEFQSLGEVELAKGWGSEEIYVVLRPKYDQGIDPKSLRIEKPSNQKIIFDFSPNSLFGGRLRVTSGAKERLGEYCVKQKDFWLTDDVVFLESGTIPVYMLNSLYQKRNPPTPRPRLLITNNVICSGVAMMAHTSEDDASLIVHPEDKPMDIILAGGRVFDDYAATIPEDFVPHSANTFNQSNELTELLNATGVNHVIMMVTRLTRYHGPCARSAAMRRFKKLLLRYVATNDGVRLSILAEADKLAVRHGDSADTIDLPNDESTSYWEEVLRRGPTIIVAVSQRISENVADLGLAKRELRALREAGASCILLGLDGSEISFD